MAKRQVWVIEGRRHAGKPWQSTNSYAWRVQVTDYSLKRLRERLKLYRDGRNPRAEFRIRKYVPEKP